MCLAGCVSLRTRSECSDCKVRSACISWQAKLDSRAWCGKGLKSIMISLSGSLNNAKLYNRTHSLMAETRTISHTGSKPLAYLYSICNSSEMMWGCGVGLARTMQENERGCSWSRGCGLSKDINCCCSIFTTVLHEKNIILLFFDQNPPLFSFYSSKEL